MNNNQAFRLMQKGFSKAESVCPSPVAESNYIIAGQVVRFRVVGHKLARHLHQPIAHLWRNDLTGGPPQLTIELWDEAMTSIGRPEPCTKVLKRNPDSEFIAYRFQGTLVHFDRLNRHMIGCVANAEELSLYERGRPLHPPLARWLNDQRVPLIHAGVICKNGKGVLLAGTSGSGKSTTAITCLEAGFQFLSDDLVALQVLPDGSCVGHSLYNSTYLEPDHLLRFPQLKHHAIMKPDKPDDKLLVLLSQICGTQLERAVKIHAIALPRVTHQSPSNFYPAPKSKALFALAPSSRKINKSLGLIEFGNLVSLVEHVPCFWLDAGDELSGISPCVEELLAAAER